MLATALVALALSASPDAHATFDVGPAPAVTASNISGPITITGTAGEKAELDAHFSGPDSARSQWTVELEGEKGKVLAKVCCGPCDATFKRSCDDGASVALTLKVPAGSSLDASEVSGGLAVSGLAGDLKVNAVSGAAELNGTQGAVKLNTVSGAVRIKAARAAKMELHAVSANLDVTLPKGASADLVLHTVSGRLNGQRGGMGSSHARLGAGGQEISANTVSGNLDVHD